MHVMIDLETMSQQPDAAICAIGAVLFDPCAPGEGLGAEFSVNVDLADRKTAASQHRPADLSLPGGAALLLIALP